MRITIEHDDGRVEVREEVASYAIFTEEDLRNYIDNYNDYHNEKIKEDDVELVRERMIELLSPDYYSRCEWMDYELEEFMGYNK